MKVCAVFFGGYKAKQEHVDRWVASAKAQKPGIEFGARPWPNGAADPDGDVGLSVFQKTGQFDSVVAALKASTADKIFIVGHSSGCAIANAVDKEVTKGLTDKSKFVLVALDGYRPDKDQLNRDNTQVWGAVSGAHKSYHYPDADEKKKLGKNFKEFKANSGVTARFALHFSLVNTAITNDTGNTEHGYDNCQANLKWVDEELKVTTP
jgi:hypothetical protein